MRNYVKLYCAIDKEHLALESEIVNGVKSKDYIKVPKNYSILKEWEKLGPTYLQVPCGSYGDGGDRQAIVIDWDNKKHEDPYNYIRRLNARLKTLGIENALFGSLVNLTNNHVQSFVMIKPVWKGDKFYLPAVYFLNGEGFGDPNFRGQNAKNPFTANKNYKFIKNPAYNGSILNVDDFCKNNGIESKPTVKKPAKVRVKTMKAFGQKIEYSDELKTNWSTERIRSFWKHHINLNISEQAARKIQKSRCYFFLCLGTFLYRNSRKNYAEFSSSEELLGRAIALINEFGMYDLSGCRYGYMLRQIENAFKYAAAGYRSGNFKKSELSAEEFSIMTQGRVWLNKAFILRSLIDLRNGRVPVWTYGKAKGSAVSQKTLEKWKATYNETDLKNELVTVYCPIKAEKQMAYHGSAYQHVYTEQLESLPYCVIYEFNKKNLIETAPEQVGLEQVGPVSVLSNNKKEFLKKDENVVKGQTLREYRLMELRGNVVEKPPEGGGMSREEILEDWKNFLRAERRVV